VAPIRLIPQSEFPRVQDSSAPAHSRLALVADMCRFNCLSAVKRAGSGHLGSSFSAMDLVVWLYFQRMNTLQAGFDSPDRDIYFSSKGHDVPGQYAVLYAAGVLPLDRLTRLRRLGGLDGHPDVGIPGIEANSGSLGMGISKGKGMAWAKRARGMSGHVFILIGDGELQEGQNYEALMTTAQQQVHGLTVIVDNNRFQTDMAVSEITDLGDLEIKFRAFGWAVERCDGHSFAAIERAFDNLDQAAGKPRILIADTIKGRGVSFMESPARPAAGTHFYRWHSGAPDNESFARGSDEIYERIRERFQAFELGDPAVEAIGEQEAAATAAPKEFVADAFGEALLELGGRRKDLVVLDGDLAADCRVRTFGQKFPDRFIENGIAEQDMVSMAGGLARSGFLPVVNSFASFLASRANEQIYNNATERSKIIYVCHFGGLIPAGPGKSHQSIRDIALFSALPHSTIIVPCNALETRQALEHLVEHTSEVGVLRLSIGPSPRRIELPTGYRLSEGRGVPLSSGRDAILFGYGPVMLHEALVASETLARQGFGLTVVNHPWVNLVDPNWLREMVGPHSTICVLEDHGPNGALGDRILAALAETESLAGRRLRRFAVEGFPACGAPGEVLQRHGLDGASLAEAILGQRPVAGMTLDERSYTLDAPQ
jgi:transketolase